jgi:hypothetical protein
MQRNGSQMGISGRAVGWSWAIAIAVAVLSGLLHV